MKIDELEIQPVKNGFRVRVNHLVQRNTPLDTYVFETFESMVAWLKKNLKKITETE